MIKAVIFDLDNTLYDYDSGNTHGTKAAWQCFCRHNYRLTEKEFTDLYNQARSEVHRELGGTASSHGREIYFQRLLEKTNGTIEAEMILGLYDAYWKAFLSKSKIFSGVLDLLKFLRQQKIKIAVVSNMTLRMQLIRIKQLKIGRYLDVLVTSEESGREKPHSSPFLLALNKLSCLAEECLVVGDNIEDDTEGGLSAGCKTLLIDRRDSYGKGDRSFKPDLKVNKISEVKGKWTEIIKLF